MITWFLFALGSAIAQSGMNALSNQALKTRRFSKISIAFIISATASVLLIGISFLFFGLPDFKPGFWQAILITGFLNVLMFPIGLKAYEVGEFSAVYSMTLATPIFLLFTSWIFLGELPPVQGMVGVVLSVAGLWMIAGTAADNRDVSRLANGNALGLLVALLASISTNFDKIAVLRSNQFIAYGIVSGVMAASYAIYLLVNKQFAKSAEKENAFSLGIVFILLLAGFSQALNGVFYNFALSTVFASYPIAVKRLGVLFGVAWGWLFFKEKNISKKVLGAAVAIAGVLLILLS